MFKLRGDRKHDLLEEDGHGKFMSVAAAVVGGGIASAAISSSASSSASNAQSNAAKDANATQLSMFNTTRQGLAPYMNVGADQANQLSQLINSGQLGGQFTNADLNANLAPNYQFQLQQGQQALQNSQAAQNGVLGGAAQKDMQNFVQNTAAGAYQNAYNNWLSTQSLNYGQRMGLASLGQNAAAMVGNNATATGQGIAQNTIGAGNAQAAGIIGGANALSSGINNAVGYYQLNNLLGNSASNNINSASSGSSNFMTGGPFGFGGVTG
jgi:hypothetical protein